MKFYRENLIKNKFEFTPDDLADQFLKSYFNQSKYYDCRPIESLLLSFISEKEGGLNSSFDLKEGNNEKEFNETIKLILKHLKNQERQ